MTLSLKLALALGAAGGLVIQTATAPHWPFAADTMKTIGIAMAGVSLCWILGIFFPFLAHHRDG